MHFFAHHRTLFCVTLLAKLARSCRYYPSGLIAYKSFPLEAQVRAQPGRNSVVPPRARFSRKTSMDSNLVSVKCTEARRYRHTPGHCQTTRWTEAATPWRCRALTERRCVSRSSVRLRDVLLLLGSASIAKLAVSRFGFGGFEIYDGPVCAIPAPRPRVGAYLPAGFRHCGLSA